MRDKVNVSSAIEVITQMGLWSKFEDGKTLLVKDIVESTGADEIMISTPSPFPPFKPFTNDSSVRIFRQLVAGGVLLDVPGPGYKLTTLGTPYLNPDHTAFSSFVFTEILPSILSLPKNLQARNYKAPSKESGSPYKWANGEELWTYLGSHPERAMNMVNGMRSLHTGSLETNAYPFADELVKMGIKEGEVAIVDVAGGQGHIMAEVRKTCPEIKGKFIVQDLASTFEASAGAPEGIEYMPYDMFTPQPVKGAYIYHYRHIFHDWSDGECSAFLQQLVPLLREQPKSKLLLVDLVLPNTDVSMQECVRDFSMFPIGGLERNEAQWRELLEKNGLRVKKIWRGTEPEACVECEVL